MPLEEIQAILTKYNNEEAKIETLLENRDMEESSTSSKCSFENKVQMCFREATKRNKELLQELAVVKGNLRSKAIFSPSEMQWETVNKNYREAPSLPVTTYRCHLPMYV